MKLEDKVGIIVGAGQAKGETVGLGRAAAILFAREGAKLLLVDRDLDSAQETAKLVADEGGTAECVVGDWTDADDCRAYAEACVSKWGRIDFLQNNVGITTDGDGWPLDVTADAFERNITVNLKGCLFSCQAVTPIMREQESGSIINISTTAVASGSAPVTAYKISKIGVNSLTQTLAYDNAKYGVRVNLIMPGMLNTPNGVDVMAARKGVSRESVSAQRDTLVPLREKQGSAWDIAKASLFLHSDDADFITGVTLPVDGGQLMRVAVW
jgi:NAD(P)-dependent dehydrogenase (short-subunit alcohol dehydrogenase family)